MADPTTPDDKDYFDWMLSEAAHGDDEQPVTTAADSEAVVDMSLADYLELEPTPKKAA